MTMTIRKRRAARALWDCGGRIDEAAARERLRPSTLRRWLADPEFRTLVAGDAMEPLLQATSAMLRWAPAAVARLIRDLEGDSPTEARQAAREILKLALDTQRELTTFPAAKVVRTDQPEDAEPEADDPLSRQVAALTDDQLAGVLAILGGAGRAAETASGAHGEASAAGKTARRAKGQGVQP